MESRRRRWSKFVSKLPAASSENCFSPLTQKDWPQIIENRILPLIRFSLGKESLRMMLCLRFSLIRFFFHFFGVN